MSSLYRRPDFTKSVYLFQLLFFSSREDFLGKCRECVRVPREISVRTGEKMTSSRGVDQGKRARGSAEKGYEFTVHNTGLHEKCLFISGTFFLFQGIFL